MQWERELFRGNAELEINVAALIRLRTSNPALQRNEVQFFYFHPDFDSNKAPRVFAYCRNGGKPLGSTGEVIVIANMGAQDFPQYDIPLWPWGASQVTEIGYAGAPPSSNPLKGMLSLALRPFSARVFET